MLGKTKFRVVASIMLAILAISISFVCFKLFMPPRLSHLKSSFAEIQPLLADLEIVRSHEEERAWPICGFDTGPEPCPSYFVQYKINRLNIVTKFDEISEKLKTKQWQEVKYDESELLCTLLRDNIDQFKLGIYGTVCERDFYRDNIKLKISSSAQHENKDPDTLLLNVRFIDSRNARSTKQ